jgi:hypothetical protein
MARKSGKSPKPPKPTFHEQMSQALQTFRDRQKAMTEGIVADARRKGEEAADTVRAELVNEVEKTGRTRTHVLLRFPVYDKLPQGMSCPGLIATPFLAGLREALGDDATVALASPIGPQAQVVNLEAAYNPPDPANSGDKDEPGLTTLTAFLDGEEGEAGGEEA